MKLAQTLTILLLLTNYAYADDLNGFYVTGEVTHSKSSLNNNYFDNRLTNAGATNITNHDDESSNQWRLQAGYKFNPYFAIEGGYIDLGKSKYKADYTTGSANGELKAGGLDIAAIGILPITDTVSVFGKAGVIAASIDSKLNAKGTASSASDKNSINEVLPLIGIGATYKVSTHVDLRADLDYVNGIGKSNSTGEMNNTMLSIGAVYNF